MSGSLRARLAATGIGYAGVDGAWWLPAAAPFDLPAAERERLRAAGNAYFLLSDAVSALHDRDPGVTSLLAYKVPPQVRSYHSGAPVLALRPDFQLLPAEEGGGFCATELESAPSAQGFAHAMQSAYGLECDLVGAWARLLQGRTLLIVGAQQWSEFLIEQLAFCRALEEAGAQGRVLYDLPLDAIADGVERRERWNPPIFGISREPAGWNVNLRVRLIESDLLRFLWPHDEAWPDTPQNVLIFRFGYLETFDDAHRARLAQWQADGVPFLNPVSFVHESKVVLAALWLPAVQRWIGERDAGALEILNSALPHTLLLTPTIARAVAATREHMVIKWAGFDGGNRAWGGRSLAVGAEHSDGEWEALLHHALSLPFPVVAQRLTPSLRVSIPYLSAQGAPAVLEDGATRLRCFVQRDESGVSACGTHITVTNARVCVSEASDAVQAPVRFVPE